MDTKTLLSFENPLFFAAIIVIVILVVMFIFYRYIIIPMRIKHLRQQETLRLQQAEMMAKFAELSPDLILRVDEEGKVILANNASHKTFPNHGLLGESIKNILPFLASVDIREIISNDLVTTYEWQLEQSFYQFLIAGVSKFQVCQVYGRDISTLKRTEEHLKVALVKAEESKRLKEYFLAQISHEIRSPLNVIVGYSDYLREDLGREMGDTYSHILYSIKNNSKRLYRTFDLLLNMSQLQAGKYERRLEKINLNSLLNTVIAEFYSMAEEKKLSLTLINETGSDVVLILDHYSITQVFMNLVDNAIKYTERGKIEIKIRRVNGFIHVDVSDTGKGMAKEYVDKLFTPFTQEEMGYTRRYDGTGLGLAIVKSFVEHNDGLIKVKSETNSGTTFTIILKEDVRWGIQPKNPNSL